MGWTRRRTEAELRNVPADVERGLWAPASAGPRRNPRPRASTSSRSGGSPAGAAELREATIADYTWQLCNHLLPFFHAHQLP